MKAEKSRIVTVSLPAELARGLVEFAGKERRPVSWVAQDALRAYLDGRGPVEGDAQHAAGDARQPEVER